MKVTVKTVSDRITILEKQQTLSLNEEFTLECLRQLLASLTARPVAYTDAEELETMRKGTFADMFTPCDEYKSDPLWIPLFTRSAPAAVPAVCEVARAALDWIDAVPRETILPAMPGFDREWAENVLLDAKRIAFIDSLADNTSTQYDSLRKAEE